MDEQAPGLRDVWRMLLRHRVLIATVTGAMTAASLVYSITQPKVYTATARLENKAPISPLVLDMLGSNGRAGVQRDPQDVAETIDSSTALAERVLARLSLDNTPEQLLGATKAKVVTEGIIEVTATAPKNPDLAAALANGFVEEFIAMRNGEVAAEITRAQDATKAALDAERARLTELDRQLGELNQRIAVLSSPGLILSAEQTAEKGRLISQRDSLEEQASSTRDSTADAEGQVRQYEIAKGTIESATVIRTASVPKKPSSPKPMVDGAVGLMVGLIAGVVAAYGRNHFDRRIRTRDDAARAAGAPVLAAVPKLDWKGAPSADTLVSISEPASPAAEQYRALRANLAAQGLGTSIRCLLVASPGKGEGRSSTVANLAVACANSGLKTLAVSADPRRPTLHAFFEVPDAPGLPEVLRGHAPLSAAIFMTAIPNLFVLPSRPDPATGSDLLASQRLQEVLAEATAHADIVLVDVTAIADGADTSILARLVGHCLLVLEADHTERTASARAATTIRQAGARIVGTVLNRASAADETAGVPETPADLAYFNAASNGHKLPEPPLVLTGPWGDGFSAPRGLPSPRPQSTTTWEGEEA